MIRHLTNINNSEQQITQQEESIELVNAEGILNQYQIMLILILIFIMISRIWYQSDTHLKHIKQLSYYFNSRILGNDYIGLYDMGNNIEEFSAEFIIYQDMTNFFADLFNTVQQFHNHGFTYFNRQQNSNKLTINFKNNSQVNQINLPLQQLQRYFDKQYLRNLILQTSSLRIQIPLGANKLLNNFTLIFQMHLHSQLMLQVNFVPFYITNQKTNQNSHTLLIIQQLIAIILISTYAYSIIRIKMEQVLQSTRQSKLYWLIFLIILNILIITFPTYSPMACLLQTLPIFQKFNSQQSNAYIFNSHLKYSIPIVLKIFIPVLILLNGFVMYSLLMYPGDYFDNYMQGFWSYVYQNFQVGTYQIFIELKNHGNIAYLLYSVLYFYMVLVGNNLIIALFAILVQIKIVDADLKRFINEEIIRAVCPLCGQENYQKNTYDMQICISSPKLSPYIMPGTTTKTKTNIKQPLLAKIYIEEHLKAQQNEQFVHLKKEKIKRLSNNLQTIIMMHQKDSIWCRTNINKIQNCIRKVSS